MNWAIANSIWLTDFVCTDLSALNFNIQYIKDLWVWFPLLRHIEFLLIIPLNLSQRGVDIQQKQTKNSHVNTWSIMAFGILKVQRNKLSLKKTRMHLWIEEGAKNCSGGPKGVDGLKWRVEDKDGRNNYRNSLHCVPYAKC